MNESWLICELVPSVGSTWYVKFEGKLIDKKTNKRLPNLWARYWFPDCYSRVI